jgi:hypothetical protein
VLRHVVPAAFALAAALSAQTAFFRIEDVKPGIRGVGKTVFSGNRIDEFQVELLGILENIGPKQSLILARLSGGPLAETGVLQGMSGSPVYIGNKLLGAVAMAFPFAKEPIAGIRPIQEMLPVAQAGATRPIRAAVSLRDTDLTRALSGPEEAMAGDAKMIDIATPVSFGGFTRGAIEHFAPQLRALGLEPRQGVSLGGRVNMRMGDPSVLKPGSMISVQLMTGDLSVGADGTVTHIDGNQVYAFGHRFLSIGSTELPFARAEVITLLPTLSSSFKISSPKELVGIMSQDRNTAITGELGRRAAMVPVSIRVGRGGRKLENYNMEMVRDRLLSPFLIQMAVFSAIDATERAVGVSSFEVTGEIEFDGLTSPIKVSNMFAGDSGSALPASLSAAIPLAYALQSGFETLQVKRIDLSIASYDEKKQLQIDQVAASRREVRPGENIRLTTVFTGENGREVSRNTDYVVPISATPGPLFFTVADGNVTNMTEFRQIIGNPPRSAAQVISIVNNLRTNTKAYVRVWRPDPAYQLEGEDFPDPPASVSMIFAGSQNSLAGITQTRNSKIAELDINAGDSMITGSKTIQVEVKE